MERQQRKYVTKQNNKIENVGKPYREVGVCIWALGRGGSILKKPE